MGVNITTIYQLKNEHSNQSSTIKFYYTIKNQKIMYCSEIWKDFFSVRQRLCWIEESHVKPTCLSVTS